MSEFIPNDNKAFIAMIRNTNPQLTAAAPEMYELLKVCAAFLKDCGDCSPIAYQLRLRIEKLLARIDGKED